jgi:flavin-dependent dehydrogenase
MERLASRGAVGIDRLDLRIGGARGSWSIPTLLSVRRSTLDLILFEEASASGAQVFTGVTAEVELAEDRPLAGFADQVRWVKLRVGEASTRVAAKMVIAADGLTRSSLRAAEPLRSQVASDSRIGVQTFLRPDQLPWPLTPHTLAMLVRRAGYVGLSPTDGEYINMAAAIDPSRLRADGSIGVVIESILSEVLAKAVKLPSPMDWLATPRLTRRAEQVGARQLLLIGDAIGYVEPFTGEGMSWALASAEAVLPYVLRGVRQGWNDQLERAWSHWIQHRLSRQQRSCRWFSRQLRHPRLAAGILRLCQFLPPVRRALIDKAIS